MKFISKNLNLRIVLQPSIPAAPLAGQPGRAGVYLKFENGLLNVDQPEAIEKLIAHPGYNVDFVAVEDDDSAASLIAQRQQGGVEPEHDIHEIQFGHVGKSLNPKAPIKLTPEVKNYLIKTAAELAAQMIAERDAAKATAPTDPEATTEAPAKPAAKKVPAK